MTTVPDRARSTVLMYHDVVDASNPDASGFKAGGSASYKVDPARFEQHLDAIAERAGTGAAPIGLDGCGPIAGRWCLTFDDGGVSAVAVADHLERRGWYGIFLVTTDRIGRPGFVTAAHVSELRRRGHVVGSHTRSHPASLAACPREAVRAEWCESLAVLTEILDERVVYASVPNGSYSRLVAEEAAAAGIEVLFTSEPTRRRFRVGACTVVGRYPVRSTTSAARVAAIAAGARVPRYSQWLAWTIKEFARRAAGPGYTTLRRRLRAGVVRGRDR